MVAGLCFGMPKLRVMNVMALLHYLDLRAASIRTPATCKMRLISRKV